MCRGYSPFRHWVKLRECAVLQQILLKLFSLSMASTNGLLDSFYSKYIEDNIIKVYIIGFMGQKAFAEQVKLWNMPSATQGS